MQYRLLADAVVVLHLAFIVFVVAGGVLARWRRRIVLVHVPCALYGTAIELWGWTCPLTPLENRLRESAGELGYRRGFVEHYLIGIVYPVPLTHGAQLVFGAAVAVINVGLYAWALRSRRGTR